MRAAVLTALCILAGCSSAPPSSGVSPGEATAMATSTETQTTEAATRKRQFKPPAGYKAKIHGWDIVYCRKTPVLGSRFPQEICMTEAELKEHLAAMDTMRRNKDQVSALCTSKPGCAWD
jgi:hypothetical protein